MIPDLGIACAVLASRLIVGDPEDCWIWGGYPTVRVSGINLRVGRLAYMVATGDDPGRIEIEQICKNILCCNPAHLTVSRRQKSGAPIGPPSLAFIKERLYRFIDVREQDECWPWIAALSHFGYGRIWVNGRLHMAHVLSYLVDHGTLDSDLEVLHECDYPPCCNPSHLWQGTQLENILDMHAKNRGNNYGLDNPFGKHPFTLIEDVRKSVAEGESQYSVSKRLGLNASTVYRWVSNQRREHAA